MGGGAETFQADAGFDFPIPSNALDLRIADFNGDGRPDIVATLHDSVSVLLNTTAPGSTTPTFAAHFDMQDTNSPVDPKAAIGDLNSDGRPDIVITRGGTNLLLYLNATDAGVTSPAFSRQLLTASQGARDVAIADFNADGKPDLAFRLLNSTDATQSTATVFLNTTPAMTSAPTFATPVDFPSPLGNSSQGVITALDANGDGKPDLATESNVLFNTTVAGAPVPTFAVGEAVPQMFTLRPTVTSADLNGDGKPDLVFGGKPLEVLLNLPSGLASTVLSVPPLRWDAVAADLDGDSRVDLVTANIDGSFSILLNTTPANAQTPTFAPSVDIPTRGSMAVALADFNGDGKLDVVVAEPDPNVTVFLAH
jgi:hypothetical protein